MFSSAVSVASRLKLWKMKPILSRRSCVSFFSLSRVISTPSMLTRPPVGWSRPARMCMSVLLPEPDGPMMAVSRPSVMSMSTPARACTAASPLP